MGQTRVDLQHLLEDLRDAYPGAVEGTILTEIVANSLDSGAKTVRFACDPGAATLTVADDGSGMARRELARYHDVAASTKTRGQGIGFAGVVIKLGLLASEHVLTETRRGAAHVATSWSLASRHKAPWRWVPPPGLVGERGTAVRLHLRNPLSPLLDVGFIEATLLRHFEPLFNAAFDELLAPHYPAGIRFFLNDREVPRTAKDVEGHSPISVRIGRKRKPCAAGFLFRSSLPLDDSRRGLAVSTLGKVIKRGWDWLGFSPSEPELVEGLVEVPALAESLTLNKADFIRVGSRGAAYLAYRKAIQEAVTAQLSAWGDIRGSLAEESRRRKVGPVERDIGAVLLEMAEDFPLIASLVDRRPGGQKRLPLGAPGGTGSPGTGAAPATIGSSPQSGDTPSSDVDGRPTTEPGGDDKQMPPKETPGRTAEPSLLLPSRGGRRRPTRLGLSIQFENRPDDPDLGRLLESTVWVNEGHPAYRRAAASRAEGYHIAVAVAMALAPLAVEPGQTHGFVTAFLVRWGEALSAKSAPGKSEPKKR